MAILEEKSRAYRALIVRFVIGRYGRDNIGFFWTFFEPMILCLGVMAIWTLTKSKMEHGVNVVGFVFTGYMSLTLWRHQTGYAVNLLKSVKFLLIFRNINYLDALLSRLFLEFFSVTAAGLIVLLFLIPLGIIDVPYSYSTLFQGWLLMAWMGFGAGVLIASLSELSEIVERINQPMQYFLLPFGGCFYMVDWLPDVAKSYVLYVPLVHAYEMIRGGYFGPEVLTYEDPLYAAAWGLAMAGSGFWIFERIKDKVQ